MTWIIQVLSNTWSDLTRFKWFQLKLMTRQDIKLDLPWHSHTFWNHDDLTIHQKQQEDYLLVFQFKRRIKAFHQHQVQTDQSRTEQVNKTFNLHPCPHPPSLLSSLSGRFSPFFLRSRSSPRVRSEPGSPAGARASSGTRARPLSSIFSINIPSRGNTTIHVYTEHCTVLLL